MPDTPQHAIAALAFELTAQGDGLPTEAHLLPPGPFRAEDGRPRDCAAWQLGAAIAQRVIERVAARRTDIALFYGHQDLWAEWNGKPAPAAGWCPRAMEWRDNGLYAVRLTWTPAAAEAIRAKEYRYISALFAYLPSTGEVVDILSIAITNSPALDGLDALVDTAALTRHLAALTTPLEEPMPDPSVAALTAERDSLTAKAAALTTERDGLTTQVAALTTERDGLKTKVAALEAEKAQAASVAEKEKHTALLTAALTDGRLTPAQKPWAEKQSLVALTEYLEATNPLPLAGGRQASKGDGKGGDGLTEAELAMCSRMGVTPEDFKKAKA